MKKIITYSFLVLFFVLIIIQFLKPETSNPIEDNKKFISSHVQIPDNIVSQLQKSCFDCHSYRTVWPWYSQISPIVYLINKDVEKGREHLNFSLWGEYNKSKMMDKLDGIESAIRENEMPLPMYLPLHSEAKLTDENKNMLEEWANITKQQLFNE